MQSIPVVSPGDLVGGAVGGVSVFRPLLVAEEDVVGLATPVIAVDLTGPAGTADLAAVRSAVAGVDRVLIGVGNGDPHRLGEALDLVLSAAPDPPRHAIHTSDPQSDLAALVSAVERAPRASLVLARLLRHGDALDPYTEQGTAAGLDLESLAYSTLLGGPEFSCWLTRRNRRPPPRPAPEPVLTSRDGDTLSITLNRAARRNAYDRTLRDALVEALGVALADPELTVELRGAGPCFCAGGDLDEFGTAPDPTTAHLTRTSAGAARPMAALTERLRVQVHGSCVGAGVELPAFAGSVWADPHTTFRLPEIGMGLVPGAGGTVSVTRRIGRWRTFYLALMGTPLDARTAWHWGLVDNLLAR